MGEPKGKKKRPKSKTFFEDDEIELLAQAISPQNNDDKDDTHIISPKYKSLTASGKSIPTEPISPEKPKEQEDRDIKIDSNYSKSEPTVVVSSNTSTNNDVVDKKVNQQNYQYHLKELLLNVQWHHNQLQIQNLNQNLKNQLLILIYQKYKIQLNQQHQNL